MKFLLFVGIVVALFVSLVFVLGQNEPIEYEGYATQFFPERRNILWDGITDINRVPYIKKDVKTVTILQNDRGLITWKEDLKMRKGTRTWKIIEKREPSKYVVELLDSSWGVTGTWTYILKEGEDGGTNIQVVENSKTENVWLRGLNKIRGRDIYIIRAFKEMRVLLFRNLIDTP